ncbi:hypothetical protein [Archangium sp.]|uniref:type II toxin-antitoxin system RelE family toxin n=1 Tax=Archangium sp. TaxID=1872627 RepID=UPI002D357F44|nr:hypothetical protein [Archangium sp.]HYO54877.1 hypothetical protein [Archangium sp.]
MYTVEISPPAWNQIAQLSLETYRRIREELEAVAQLLDTVKVPGHPPSTSSVVIDDVMAVYEVDHKRRRVLLIEVARRLPRDG